MNRGHGGSNGSGLEFLPHLGDNCVLHISHQDTPMPEINLPLDVAHVSVLS
jgi:hypothetical protein